VRGAPASRPGSDAAIDGTAIAAELTGHHQNRVTRGHAMPGRTGDIQAHDGAWLH